MATKGSGEGRQAGDRGGAARKEWEGWVGVTRSGKTAVHPGPAPPILPFQTSQCLNAKPFSAGRAVNATGAERCNYEDRHSPLPHSPHTSPPHDLGTTACHRRCCTWGNHVMRRAGGTITRATCQDQSGKCDRVGNNPQNVCAAQVFPLPTRCSTAYAASLDGAPRPPASAAFLESPFTQCKNPPARQTRVTHVGQRPPPPLPSVCVSECLFFSTERRLGLLCNS